MKARRGGDQAHLRDGRAVDVPGAVTGVGRMRGRAAHSGGTRYDRLRRRARARGSRCAQYPSRPIVAAIGSELIGGGRRGRTRPATSGAATGAPPRQRHEQRVETPAAMTRREAPADPAARGQVTDADADNGGKRRVQPRRPRQDQPLQHARSRSRGCIPIRSPTTRSGYPRRTLVPLGGQQPTRTWRTHHRRARDRRSSGLRPDGRPRTNRGADLEPRARTHTGHAAARVKGAQGPTTRRRQGPRLALRRTLGRGPRLLTTDMSEQRCAASTCRRSRPRSTPAPTPRCAVRRDSGTRGAGPPETDIQARVG
jgi:hypothetical protein